MWVQLLRFYLQAKDTLKHILGKGNIPLLEIE